MLSGWLLSGRVIDLEPKGSLRRYVSGCKGLVCTYLLSGCALLLFMRGFLRMPLPFREAAAYILRYDEYAWYVNMYLGLYLLMPFLNILWRGLSGKSARKKCLLCLLILTALPGLANVYDLRTPGVLLQPWNYTGQTQLVPNWWTALYPVTFYFLGAYLREHGNVRQMHTGKALFSRTRETAWETSRTPVRVDLQRIPVVLGQRSGRLSGALSQTAERLRCSRPSHIHCRFRCPGSFGRVPDPACAKDAFCPAPRNSESPC